MHEIDRVGSIAQQHAEAHKPRRPAFARAAQHGGGEKQRGGKAGRDQAPGPIAPAFHEKHQHTGARECGARPHVEPHIREPQRADQHAVGELADDRVGPEADLRIAGPYQVSGRGQRPDDGRSANWPSGEAG